MSRLLPPETAFPGLRLFSAGWRSVASLVALLPAATLLLPLPVYAAPPPPSPGVVVVDVSDDAAAAAGIRPGDLLRAWSRPGEPAGATRPFDSPVDVEEAEDQGVRGSITVLGSRERRDTSWQLSPGSWHRELSRTQWGLETRPHLEPALLALFEDGRALAKAGKVDAAAGRFCLAAGDAKRAGDRPLAGWFLLRAARALYGRKAAEYDGLLAEAATLLPERLRPHVVYERAYRSSSDPIQGTLLFEEARETWQRLDPEGPGVVRSIGALGRPARQRGDLEAWDRYESIGLALREDLAPDSLAVADSLYGLAIVKGEMSDFGAAEAFGRRALDIIGRRAPKSLLYARALGSLAYTLEERGDHSGAERMYRRSLEVSEALDSPSDAAIQLSNLGVIAARRGENAEAEAFHRRALAYKRLNPANPIPIGITLLNLTGPVFLRGDPEAAEAFTQEALQIFAAAGAPMASFTAAAHQSLGQLRLDAGDADGAEAPLRRAQAIWIERTPGSLGEAECRVDLARMHLLRGDLTLAEEEARSGLAIIEERAPGTALQANALHRLGLARWRMGDRGGAADIYCRAIDSLESQRAKLGGTQLTHAAFEEGFADLYREYVELLVEMGRDEDAFHVLERSRAKAFVSMLAERDIAFASQLPPDVAAEARRIAREYDRTLEELATADGKDRDALVERLRELQRSSEETVARVRSSSPQLASLRYPQAAGVNEARASLDPGTVLLSFSVGARKSLLFVVTPGGPVNVRPIDVTREQLTRRVDLFRRLIERGQTTRELPASLVEEGRALYRDLISPALPHLSPGSRILICPDGPLHVLPFAALVSGASPRARPTFLVESFPLHTVLSATVYDQLRKSRTSRQAQVQLAALGDPSYPAPKTAPGAPSTDNVASAADPELASALRAGLKLGPLPGSRREVLRIASLFGTAAHPFLGKEATEERALSAGKDVRYLHFACHGILDEELPLNSSLVLAVPEEPGTERDNGLLQAWEIFDRMQIDADLVTLSSCASGLGRETRGEGLIGLTRAFQYAGARSVLASLWRVADDSTGELMERLYRHLRAGRSKDEALRSAQLELIRGASGRDAQPFAWAAFQLTGDWR